MIGHRIPEDMRFLADDVAATAEGMCDSEWGGWYCTRTIGHSGKHEAAWLLNDPVAAVWDDEDAA